MDAAKTWIRGIHPPNFPSGSPTRPPPWHPPKLPQRAPTLALQAHSAQAQLCRISSPRSLPCWRRLTGRSPHPPSLLLPAPPQGWSSQLLSLSPAAGAVTMTGRRHPSLSFGWPLLACRPLTPQVLCKRPNPASIYQPYLRREGKRQSCGPLSKQPRPNPLAASSPPPFPPLRRHPHGPGGPVSRDWLSVSGRTPART